MAISEELKKIYSDYGDTRQFYDTVQLYHPNFKVDGLTNDPYPSAEKFPSATLYPTEVNTIEQSYFLIRNDTDKSLQIEDLSLVTFQAYPFDILQPQVGEDQQDIGIVLDNVSLEIITQIELAAQNTSVPIQMTFRVYMDGDTTSQITPITLALTEVVVDMNVISCKASRVDLFKRRFPYGSHTYYDSKFEGLTV